MEFGFVAPEICFVAHPGTKQCAGLHRRRADPAMVQKGLKNKRMAGATLGLEPSACGVLRGGVEGLMPRIALYPGSFDPVTNGHLDVVRHAVGLCDRLVLAIGLHTGNASLCTVAERTAMLRELFEPVASSAGCEFDCVTFD